MKHLAASVEGAYPYLCSFPGHHRLMHSILSVTNDLKSFLARNPQQEINYVVGVHSFSRL